MSGGLLLAGVRRVGAERTAEEPVEVLLQDGRISAIGLALDAAGVERVELDGRYLAPGMWDGHVHMGQWSAVSRRLDLSGAGSAAEAAALVRARVDAGWDSSEILLGYGFRDALWADAPDVESLEVGETAVALVSGDVHTVWSNRALLRRAGLPDDAWWLNEQPAFDLNARLSATDATTLDRWVADAARAAAARGVTGIVDLEMGGAVEAWERRIGEGLRTLRVKAGVYPADLERVRARRLRSGDPILGADGLGADGLGTVGWFKLFTDGALNSRTAWCVDAYPDGDGGHGLPSYPDAELRAVAREALAAGLIPTIHAIGDRALTQALDTFAALGIPADAPLAPRIEHAQLLRPGDAPRFAALGVQASVQPEHAMDDRDVADHHWAGRTDRAYAYRALLDAGAQLVLGSDAPVAPLDPWVTLSAAVTRTRDAREPWHPEQALPLPDALRASWGGVDGLRVGGLADLAILDADPHAVAPEALRTLPVHATVVAGARVG
ncbi:amidohydrolase [Protaetiibacter larvae]|uniref:Amidohydrolase family protein n=1 Tax=Protaetiibacter larvae TaxID=2592654 RepID=A0A5C1Y6M0_9MICO|nr:amidohydrolase family protein [Protaetiibacter larvae]QEO09693.1 amidohydrolase family protein [Protaetiibacter larvae]